MTVFICAIYVGGIIALAPKYGFWAAILWPIGLGARLALWADDASEGGRE